MPFGPMYGGGFGVQSAGPLAPPRMPWNTAGMFGNPIPGLAAMGVGLPPPPPFFAGGAVPPFAPGGPVWAGGVAPGLGVGMMGGMGMGMGMGGFFPGMHRPAPGMIAEAIAPEQPPQGDITQIGGGVPPGATHVESSEHTIIHLLKGPVYPWVNHGMPMEVEILHMASTTSINRLIQICNNNSPDNEGFAISECHEMVNGMWEKGQTFVFDDAMSRVLTIKDAGWDNQRNRTGGQSLHIFLHRV